MNKSLEQPMRDDLQPLAGAEQWVSELKTFEAPALALQGCLQGWRFDRDKADARA